MVGVFCTGLLLQVPVFLLFSILVVILEPRGEGGREEWGFLRMVEFFIWVLCYGQAIPTGTLILEVGYFLRVVVPAQGKGRTASRRLYW